jgi:hypothetical protein
MLPARGDLRRKAGGAGRRDENLVEGVESDERSRRDFVKLGRAFRWRVKGRGEREVDC